MLTQAHIEMLFGRGIPKKAISHYDQTHKPIKRREKKNQPFEIIRIPKALLSQAENNEANRRVYARMRHAFDDFIDSNARPYFCRRIAAFSADEGIPVFDMVFYLSNLERHEIPALKPTGLGSVKSWINAVCCLALHKGTK